MTVDTLSQPVGQSAVWSMHGACMMVFFVISSTSVPDTFRLLSLFPCFTGSDSAGGTAAEDVLYRLSTAAGAPLVQALLAGTDWVRFFRAMRIRTIITAPAASGTIQVRVRAASR